MKDIADYFKKVELRQRYNDNIVCMDSLIRAKKGDCIGAIEYFKMHIKNYTDEAKDGKCISNFKRQVVWI